jgi:predicted lipoprotein
MKTKRSRRALRVAVAVAIAAGVLALLRPWTVVPIETTAERTFDPKGYVASVWDSQVLPTADRIAIELQTFMERADLKVGSSTSDGTDLKVGSSIGGGTRAVFVKGTASIAEVDRKSRIGLARLRLPWAESGQAAAIQIGPVLRGTALRDALEFIRFTDFVNQLEFAGVANSLNERVMTNVLAAVNADDLAGREVTFVGAIPLGGGSATLEIVPVRLQVAGGTR